jgi:NAD(P)-dependent dehydrogenase (short-subunit alcohol dehydrogenase family)
MVCFSVREWEAHDRAAPGHRQHRSWLRARLADDVPLWSAKAAVINFTTTLAMEWAPHNIRSIVLPGPIETEGYLEVPSHQPECG